MPHTTTCHCSAQGKSTIPGCSLPQMPPHQRKFLDSLPVGYLVLARLEDRITEGLPENEYCLTEAEWTSLIAYTTMPAPDDLNGAALNAKLRSCCPSSERTQHYRDTLMDALDKLPAVETWVIRRTKLPDCVLDRYRKGSEVTHAGFTCASESSYDRWLGPHLFLIESRNGKRISHYSAVSNGQEVLFKAGTRFCVTRRDDHDDCIIFELQEI